MQFHLLLFGAGQPRARGIALRFVDHPQFVPCKRVVVVLGHGTFEHAFGLGKMRRVFGCKQRVGERRGDQRLVPGQIDCAAQRRDGFERAPGFEQNLAFQLQGIGIVGFLCQDRVGFGQRFVHERLLVIGIGARIVRRHIGQIFRIRGQRLLRFGQISV